MPASGLYPRRSITLNRHLLRLVGATGRWTNMPSKSLALFPSKTPSLFDRRRGMQAHRRRTSPRASVGDGFAVGLNARPDFYSPGIIPNGLFYHPRPNFAS